MGNRKIKQKLQQCIEAHRAETLSEEMLNDVLEAVSGSEGKSQDLLYLQATSTSLTSPVNGMLLMEGGEIAEEMPDAEDWPYQTVLEAVRDGWRVVQFPNLAVLLDESRSYGLGCEFILER